MRRWTLRTVRQVFVQSAFGKALAVLMALGWLLPSYLLRLSLTGKSKIVWGVLGILCIFTPPLISYPSPQDPQPPEIPDLQPPEILVNIPDDSLWLKRVVPQVIVRDDTDPTPSFTIELNGEPFENGTPIVSDHLAVYELRVTAIDDSGNTSEKVVFFQILPEPHYEGDLRLVKWNWWTEGEYAGLDAWVMIKGPLRLDSRFQPAGDSVIPALPVCVVEPLYFSLDIVGEDGLMLNAEKGILPAGLEECPKSPPSPSPCKSVFYDYTHDIVVLHYHVEPRERLLRKGEPSEIVLVGAGQKESLEFTFESRVSVVVDSSLENLLESVVEQGNCRPCSNTYTPTASTPAECRCRWKSYPARKFRPSSEGIDRIRGCAVIVGFTQEKYKIHARPHRIDGRGYAIDICEAQSALIPPPGFGLRGVVTSGMEAKPALKHLGPCCCKRGPQITVSGNIAFSVSAWTRGAARAAMAGVIRVATDIGNIQAAGGLNVGSGASTIRVNIGGVQVDVIDPGSDTSTQLFFDSKVITKKASRVSMQYLTGIWISMTANGNRPFIGESMITLKTTEKRLTFHGYCEDCGHSGVWELE